MNLHPAMLAIFFETSRIVVSMCAAGIALLVIGAVVAKNDAAQARGLEKIVVLGNLFFAMPLAVFGAEHLSDAKSIAQLVPRWMPWHLFWTYFVGFALIFAALSIALRMQVALSGTLLGIMFCLFVAMMDIPGVVGNPRNRFGWVLAVRELSFASGAFALAAADMDPLRARGANALVTLARIVLSIAAIFYGVEHFLHPGNVPVVPLEMLLPGWIPAHTVIGYVSGAALIAAGTSMLLDKNKKARTAATYLGSLILLLVLLVYLPIVIASASATGAGEKIDALNYFFDTLFFGGTVLVLANALPKDSQPG